MHVYKLIQTKTYLTTASAASNKERESVSGLLNVHWSWSKRSHEYHNRPHWAKERNEWESKSTETVSYPQWYRKTLQKCYVTKLDSTWQESKPRPNNVTSDFINSPVQMHVYYVKGAYWQRKLVQVAESCRVYLLGGSKNCSHCDYKEGQF